MKIEWLIAGGAGVVGFLLWRRAQQQKQQPSGGDLGDAACQATCTASLGENASDKSQMDSCMSACKAAEGIIGSIWNAVSGDVGGDEQRSFEAADAGNAKLNGGIEIPTHNGVYEVFSSQGLEGSALRFKNGCVPFGSAPGWEKCAPGTQDMRWYQGQSDWNPTSQPIVAPTVRASREENPPAPINQWLLSTMFTGNASPVTPDPTTYGGTRSPDGINILPDEQMVWVIAGKPITCPKGQSPVRIAFDQFATWGHPRFGQCEDASIYGPTYQTSVSTGGAHGSGQIAGCDGAHAPAGFTWDPSNGGFWRRAAAGEVINDGPCAQQGGQTFGVGGIFGTAGSARIATGAGQQVVHR